MSWTVAILLAVVFILYLCVGLSNPTIDLLAASQVLLKDGRTDAAREVQKIGQRNYGGVPFETALRHAVHEHRRRSRRYQRGY
ncbi:hypothetical protein LTR53_013694 [Teratosphaeriaceae sp. CCFEE 6253]|nr:hypothetical protein LTR53_013694 [Teratosphaeriaceae sp. CCFEE 6253]